jgi:hypothetical protein
MPMWAYDLSRNLVRWVEGLMRNPVRLPTYTVSTLPEAATWVNCMIYVSNESGGAVPAFSDGAAWRRVTDRAVVS